MALHRREFIRTAAAGLAAAPVRRPNVLFVLADEWRAQATGYSGDGNVRAPVLDRLQAESVHFENAVSGCAVCCPYRASLYIPPEKRFGFDYWKACECTHEYNHSLYYEGNDSTPRYWPGYDAIAQTEDACRFIETHAQGNHPFLLELSLGPPHFPDDATAPEHYQAMYRDRDIQFRRNVPENRRQEAAGILRGCFCDVASVKSSRIFGAL